MKHLKYAAPDFEFADRRYPYFDPGRPPVEQERLGDTAQQEQKKSTSEQAIKLIPQPS